MLVSPRETIVAGFANAWRGSVCASLLLVGLWPNPLSGEGLAAGIGTAHAEDVGFFRIGTAATAGSFFEIGGIIAGAVSKPADSPPCDRGGSCGVPGLVAVAQATRGSLENLKLIDAGQIESGFAQADLAAWAYSGSGPFAGQPPMPRLRVIASLFPESLHLVVAGDSAIQTVGDLKGRRVSLGEPDSGTLVTARLVLAEAGLGDGDFTAEYLRPAQEVEGLQNGKIDAFFLVGGYPVSAIVGLASSVPIRLVPLDPELLERVRAKYGFYRHLAIPAGTYPGVHTETPSLGFRALWLVSAQADADLVYAITRALWSSSTTQLLKASDPIGAQIRLDEALLDSSVPLHPGAERFYQEAGLPVDSQPIANNEEAR